jgi:acyl-CoA synthetase (AMP-forming)/AMP-acid ligase II
MNVRALMAQAARYNGTRIAVIHGDRRLTFDEAWDRGVRLANGLLALGLQPGDRVAVLEDNCIEAADFILRPQRARSAPAYDRPYRLQSGGGQRTLCGRD